MATIVSVSASPVHAFSKPVLPAIELLAGLGVAEDVHSGVTVKHRSRVARDPTQPNLRQVHLLHAELLDELASFGLAPGDVGENILTRGMNLLALPLGTRLRLGAQAVVQVTGLRNPCAQLDRFRPGLMAATLDHDEQGRLIRKAGIMAIVLEPGTVRPGDTILAELPVNKVSLEPV